jgi:endonuclease/exonuclease/phosphatase family metal-dependent hydrolase
MKAKTGLFFVDKIILWLNVILCAALLISYLAPVTNPQIFWPIAFFGLAYPVLLMANLIMVFYWVFRRKLYLLLPITCIACGWNVLNNNIGFNKPVKDPELKDGKVIRLMTYNVHNFKRYGAKNDTSTKQQILQIIKDQRPDILTIQEFFTRKRGKYNIRDSVLAIMGSDYYYFEPLIFNKSEAIGIAIFSKFPIIDHGIIPVSDRVSENACIYADLQKGNQKLRIYNVHLQSIGFDPEDYRYVNNIIQQGKPDMYSTKRLGNKLKAAFEKRSLQVKKIKSNAAACPYPFIIAGDFNDTPASYAVNEMAEGLKNAFREKGYGLGRTYNGNFPNYQIDYIMASKRFNILNYTIIEQKLSDHYPVRSDLVMGSLVH